MEDGGAIARGESALVCCAIPGHEIVVEIAASTLNGLLLEALGGLGLLARGRGVECGGILLGWAHSDGRLRRIRIEDFRAIACQHGQGPAYVLAEAEQEHLRRVAAAWARRPGRSRYFVGYWRSHARGPLVLRRQDHDLLASLRPLRAELALLIEPHGAGPSTAAVFLTRNEDAASPEPAATLEIAPVLGASARGDAGGSKQAGVPAAARPAHRESEIPPEPAQEFRFSLFEATAGQPTPSRPRRRWWILVPLALLLLAGAGTVAIRKGYVRVPAQATAQDPYALGLRVQSLGANLHVTWNRNGHALEMAEQALLTITDGDRLQVIELTRGQLQGGSVVYRPIGDRLSFRLELRWGRQVLAEEATWEGQ